MSAMSKLEACNELLLAIGQAPVNTLEVAGIRDVSIAVQILDNVSREVQSEGHTFNSFVETLTPNVSGHIIIPADSLSVDAAKGGKYASQGWRDVIPRTDTTDGLLKLYDQDERTFVFAEPIEAEVIKLLSFESLPQHARRLIVSMAKLRFQASVVGSAMLNQLFNQEVGMAYAAFRKNELIQQDNNMLTSGGTDISRGRHRLKRYWR